MWHEMEPAENLFMRYLHQGQVKLIQGDDAIEDLRSTMLLESLELRVQAHGTAGTDVLCHVAEVETTERSTKTTFRHNSALVEKFCYTERGSLPDHLRRTGYVRIGRKLPTGAGEQIDLRIVGVEGIVIDEQLEEFLGASGFGRASEWVSFQIASPIELVGRPQASNGVPEKQYVMKNEAVIHRLRRAQMVTGHSHNLRMHCEEF
jgi:hypothetical protein